MKKMLFILVGIMFLLVACSPIQKVSNLERTNESFEIDKKAKTIRHKEDIYYYEIEDNTIRILYPNQGVYWWTDIGNSGYGDWNEQYSAKDYIRGSILIDVIKATKVPTIPLDKIILVGVLILVGIMYLFYPRTMWHLWGLHDYMNRELLKFGLGVMQIIGMIVLGFAILICI